jgi:hypothetical protein
MGFTQVLFTHEKQFIHGATGQCLSAGSPQYSPMSRFGGGGEAPSELTPPLVQGIARMTKKQQASTALLDFRVERHLWVGFG